MEELFKNISFEEQIPGTPGKDGKDGKDGLDGKDGVNGKNGLNGKDGINGKDGLDGKDGQDGSPDTGEQIVKKINDQDTLIKKEKIEGLDSFTDRKLFDDSIATLQNRTQLLNQMISTRASTTSSSSGTGGTPGSPSGSIQFNNSGVFGGSSNATLDSSGNATIASLIDTGLTASKLVFTDGSKQLTSTGIGTSGQFIKGDGSLDSSTYLTSVPLTSTYVGYGSGGNVLTGSTNFTFDGTNTTLLGYIWDKGRNKVFTQIVAPTGNSSTTGALMMGCGSTAYITPQFSGTIKVMTTGNLNAPSSSGGQAAVSAWYGTGTAPTNGASTTGTEYGDQRFVKNSSSTVYVQRDFAFLKEITGLSVGTTYWFDISVNRYGSGTATANNISFYLEETP